VRALVVIGSVVVAGLTPHYAALATEHSAQAPCPVGTTPVCPYKDPLYQAPKHLGSLRNGTVIRSRAISVKPPNGPLAGSAHIVIYKSTSATGRPVADATTILMPKTAYTGKGRRPLVSYQVAEDSLGAQCAPSYSLVNGTNGNTSAENVIISSALALGWIVAVPDYEGPDGEYGAGAQAGHAVLDGIRAAEHFSPDGLSHKTPVGLWGYSGGGLASAWAAEMQAGYAPRLHIVGSAEGGVPSDVKAVAKAIDGTAFAGIELAAAEGIARAYPGAHIDRVLNAKGRAAFQAISDECITTYTGQYPLAKLNSYTKKPDVIDSRAFAHVLALTHLEKHAPITPIYNYQSMIDELIPYRTDLAMVKWYCTHGVKVDHVPYATAEHVALAAEGAPAALLWLQGRFDGAKVIDNCPRA
jgi:hypothetical protein